MVRVFDLKQVSSLLNVIGTSEQNIDFLERDAFGFRNHEEDEDGEEDVAGHEEEE
jgi:hypothetical protein